MVGRAHELAVARGIGAWRWARDALVIRNDGKVLALAVNAAAAAERVDSGQEPPRLPIVS